MRDDGERILVIERARLDQAGAFQGLTFDIPHYAPWLLDPRAYRFLRRADAEKDERFKQLIPYFVVTHAGQVWCYVRGRQSGEDRLVAKASIGIGGHINQSDEDLFEDIYTRGALRELEEEIILPAGYTHRLVALLNDDTTPVGRVHLGLVHVLRCPSADVRRREAAMTEAGFRTPEALRELRPKMETWSQICLDHLEELLARGLAADASAAPERSPH